MSKILCSTGALIGRANGRDYRILEGLSRQLTCDGFEFMMYAAWYDEVEELLQTLKKMELEIPVVHADKGIGELISQGGEANLQEAKRLFEINCQIAKELQSRKVVLHLWNGRSSDLHFDNQIQAYPYLEQIAKQYDLVLLIENIVCNGADPMKRWCELKAVYPEIRFVYDTKMAEFHGQMELLYQKEYAWLWKEGHICHYHVNDYAGGYKDWKNLRTLPIGAGHVDFPRFFAYIREIGYDDTFTLESTMFGEDGVVDVETMNRQIAYVRESSEQKE